MEVADRRAFMHNFWNVSGAAYMLCRDERVSRLWLGTRSGHQTVLGQSEQSLASKFPDFHLGKLCEKQELKKFHNAPL